MEYIQCKRCLMDTTASNISFDDKGICNYCKDFERLLETQNSQKKMDLIQLVEKIKNDGKNKKI